MSAIERARQGVQNISRRVEAGRRAEPLGWKGMMAGGLKTVEAIGAGYEVANGDPMAAAALFGGALITNLLEQKVYYDSGVIAENNSQAVLMENRGRMKVRTLRVIQRDTHLNSADAIRLQPNVNDEFSTLMNGVGSIKKLQPYSAQKASVELLLLFLTAREDQRKSDQRKMGYEAASNKWDPLIGDLRSVLWSTMSGDYSKVKEIMREEAVKLVDPQYGKVSKEDWNHSVVMRRVILKTPDKGLPSMNLFDPVTDSKWIGRARTEMVADQIETKGLRAN